MRDLKAESAAVARAFSESRFDDALALIECMPTTYFDLTCYYLAATIYESGCSSRGTDYSKALEYFRMLDLRGELMGSVGAEGLARTLSKKDCCANQELIEQYCLRAIELDGSLPASFILAQMYEKCQANYSDARKHYLRMFRHRRPFGLRYFARSHMTHGNKSIGILAHIATTIISPFLFVINRGSISPDIR